MIESKIAKDSKFAKVLVGERVNMTISGLDLLFQLDHRRLSLELNFGSRGGRVFFAAP